VRALFAFAAAALSCSSVASAAKVATGELIRMAQLHAPDIEQALRDTLADAKEDKLAKGSAYAGDHGQFIFAVAVDKQPQLLINGMPPLAAGRAPPINSSGSSTAGSLAGQTTLLSLPKNRTRSPACRRAN
jgi:hypothetical protein